MRGKGTFLLAFWGAVALSSTANPQGFDPNVRVDDGSYACNRHLSDLTCTPQGDLFCVWSDNSSGADNVYVSKSTDGGQSWSSPFRLNDQQSPGAASPSIGCDISGNLYVVWSAGPDSTRILFTCSRNNGNRWLIPNVRVDDGTISVKSCPDIAVDQTGNIYVVWRDDRRGQTFDIYSSCSDNWGFSWSEPDIRVSDNHEVTFRGPPSACAWGDGQLAVSWADDREATDLNIYFAHSSDSGNTFSSPNHRVNSEIPGDQTGPDLSWYDGTIYAAYSSATDRLNSDIYFNRSTDFGHSWMGTEVMVNPPGEYLAQTPDIAMAGPGHIGIVWAANLYDSSFYDLFFSRSYSNGDTWLEPVQVNDDGQGSFQHGEPALALGPNTEANVSFFDYREAEPHIYFAAETTSEAFDVGPSRESSPEEISLVENYPNPFNSTTRIIYRLPCTPSSSKLSLKVYDLTGRLVRALLEAQSPGDSAGEPGQLSWDGSDQYGIKVASGLYLLKLEYGELKQTAKMVLRK